MNDLDTCSRCGLDPTLPANEGCQVYECDLCSAFVCSSCSEDGNVHPVVKFLDASAVLCLRCADAPALHDNRKSTC